MPRHRRRWLVRLLRAGVIAATAASCSQSVDHIVPTPTDRQATSASIGSGSQTAETSASNVPSPSGADASTTCGVTPFSTIPENATVDWQSATWQRATDGLWGHPYMATYDESSSGFASSDANTKILWWLSAKTDAVLTLHVQRADGQGPSHEWSFPSPGHLRQDRPTGFPMPSPGCYQIDVEVGEFRGSIIDRVVP